MRRRYGKDENSGEKNVLLWVAPGSVRYDREDIDFLLPWLEHMREGAYPVEPSGGYAEGKRSGIASHAYYEVACQVAAEIDSRLAMTSTDREFVEKFYCLDWTHEDIARWYGTDIWDVRRRIRSAVSYISSGPCPRWLNCIDCPKYRTCRRKKRVGKTYREWVRYRNKEENRKRKYTNLPSKA